MLFRSLRLVARGWPLPLASIRNRRSLVSVGNLVEAIIAVAASPAAPSNAFLVSDGEDVSTPDLVNALATALDVPARLVPCPVALLKFAAAMAGKTDAAARLTGSLQVDSSKIRRHLGWQPHVTLAAGLAEMGRWYHAQSGSRLPSERR